MVLVRLTFGSDIQGGFKSVRLGASLNIQRLGMNMVAYWGRFVPSLMIFSSFLKNIYYCPLKLFDSTKN